MNRSPEFVDNLLTKTRDHEVNISANGIIFLGIHVDYLNRSSPYKDWLDSTCIQHYKGVMGTIILKDSKDDRYNKFIKKDVYCLTHDQANNLSKRIELFRGFLDKNDSDRLINIMSIYRVKLSLYCILKIIIKVFR